MPIESNLPPEPKVRTIKFKTKMTGLFLHVEGDPQLVAQALKECLELVTPLESPSKHAT